MKKIVFDIALKTTLNCREIKVSTRYQTNSPLKIQFQAIFEDTLTQLLVFDRKRRFDPLKEIPVHPVGAGTI